MAKENKPSFPVRIRPMMGSIKEITFPIRKYIALGLAFIGLRLLGRVILTDIERYSNRALHKKYLSPNERLEQQKKEQ